MMMRASGYSGTSVLLCSIVLIHAVWKPVRAQTTGSQLNVCVVHFPPFSIIGDDGTLSGYEVSEFRKLADIQSLTFNFVPLHNITWRELAARATLNLTDPDVCHVCIGGFISDRQTLMNKNVYITQHIYSRSGLQVAVRMSHDRRRSSPWLYVQAFSWEVWLLLGGTGVTITLLTMLAEALYALKCLGSTRYHPFSPQQYHTRHRRRRHHQHSRSSHHSQSHGSVNGDSSANSNNGKKPASHKPQQSDWAGTRLAPASLWPGGMYLLDGLMRVLGVQAYRPLAVGVESLPGRILLGAWSGLVLVLGAFYIASLTAVFSTWQWQHVAQARLDAGMRVATWSRHYEAAASHLEPMGITPIALDLQSSEDVAAAWSRLASGEFDGLAMDSPWLQARMSEDCSVAVAEKSRFSRLEYVYLVNPSLPWLGPTIDQQLLDDEDDGRFEKLEQAFLKKATCKEDLGTQLHLSQLWGIWIEMAGGMFIALAVAGLPWLLPSLSLDAPAAKQLQPSVAAHDPALLDWAAYAAAGLAGTRDGPGSGGAGTASSAGSWTGCRGRGRLYVQQHPTTTAVWKLLGGLLRVADAPGSAQDQAPSRADVLAAARGSIHSSRTASTSRPHPASVPLTNGQVEGAAQQTGSTALLPSLLDSQQQQQPVTAAAALIMPGAGGQGQQLYESRSSRPGGRPGSAASTTASLATASHENAQQGGQQAGQGAASPAPAPAVLKAVPSGSSYASLPTLGPVVGTPHGSAQHGQPLAARGSPQAW